MTSEHCYQIAIVVLLLLLAWSHGRAGYFRGRYLELDSASDDSGWMDEVHWYRDMIDKWYAQWLGHANTAFHDRLKRVGEKQPQVDQPFKPPIM